MIHQHAARATRATCAARSVPSRRRSRWFPGLPSALPAAFLAASLAILAPAAAAAQSKPSPRPVVPQPAGPHAANAVLLPAVAPVPSPRPGAAQTFTAETPVIPVSAGAAGFTPWLRGFAQRARAEGIPAEVINTAFAGIRYDASIIAKDRHQAEFVKPIWEYLDGAVSASRIRTGRAMLARHDAALRRIEARYGVDRHVVVAIWGLESSFGGYRGSTDVIEALATLAYDGRRGAFFEAQLLAALKILASGDVAPRAMTGSWAGAMGHTQFMPTSYLDHAVDFTGDGRRDIWSSDPTDALASTAAYLRDNGWRNGQPWAREVRLPQGFDYALSGRGTTRSVAAWERAGIRASDGRPLPRLRRASILLPAGARGPALMIFDNFEAIERYNSADVYVIAVGHLSDRLRGQADFAASWPRGDRMLARAEKVELQRRLEARGFSVGGVDGKIGPNTIEAIQRYQRAAGLVADGYATPGLLAHLR